MSIQFYKMDRDLMKKKKKKYAREDILQNIFFYNEN